MLQLLMQFQTSSFVVRVCVHDQIRPRVLRWRWFGKILGGSLARGFNFQVGIRVGP